MFKPEEVVRDKYGYYFHTAIMDLEEGVLITDHPAAEDMEFKYIERPDDFDVDSESVANWTPETPEGEGWFLVSVYATEDGDYASFARPKRITVDSTSNSDNAE